MKTSRELSAKLNARMETLGDKEGEERNAILRDIEGLTNELNTVLAAEAALKNKPLQDPEKREIKRFSISKFLREAYYNNLTGLEREMNDEAIKERANAGITGGERFSIPTILLREGDPEPEPFPFYNIGTATEGAEFAHVTRISYAEALRNNLVCAKAGATYLTGLQGNVRIVKGGGASASWLAEGASAPKAKQTFSAITMSPKRLQILSGYTLDLLKQTSLDVDAHILRDMIRSHAEALDAAILAGTGSDGQPTGVLNASGINSVGMGPNGGNINFAKLVQMEEKVGIDNGLLGSLVYITNSKVNSKLKTTPQVAGYPVYLKDSNGISNGYPVLVSNAVPSNLTKGTSSKNCSAILFGNWNEVLAGQWGGIDILIDPLSSKDSAVIEVTAYAYHDVCVRRADSFCKIADITT
jgi:hypothetical protein